jgi:hypothetical protein
MEVLYDAGSYIYFVHELRIKGTCIIVWNCFFSICLVLTKMVTCTFCIIKGFKHINS